MKKTLSIIYVSTLLVACGGGATGSGEGGNPDETGDASRGLMARQLAIAAAPSTDCPTGGSTFEFGFDQNGNNTLDDAEVDNARTQTICNGAEGAEGQAGLSAYQIWLLANNEGTEAEFLASLAGTNGTDGNNGTDGENGTDGSNGTSAPSITSSSFFYLNENSSDTYTAVAVDADAGDSKTFAISGGEDKAIFNIDSVSGVLSFKTTPDFESPADMDGNNVYEVDLSVTDGTFITTKALFVKVRNVNVTPAVVSAAITSAPTADGMYKSTEVINIVVTLDSDVNVTGSPQVALQIGEAVKYATYQTGTGSDTLTFSYTVVTADSDNDGISINANALDINGGSIASVDTNDGVVAKLTFTAIAANNGQQVENDAPALTASTVTKQFTQTLQKTGAASIHANPANNVVLADKDNDGDLDMLYMTVWGPQGWFQWLRNNNGKLDEFELPTRTAAFGSAFDAKDINADGFADMVSVSGGIMRLSISNDSEVLVSHDLDFTLIGQFARGNVLFHDVDNDNDLDIVSSIGNGNTVDLGDVGLGAGSQNYSGRILVVLNNGNNVFTTSNVHFMSDEILDRNGEMLTIVDLNNDNLPDIIATSAAETVETKIFKNTTTIAGSPSFQQIDLGFNSTTATRNSIYLDVNGDDFQDILIPGLRSGTNASALADDAGYLTLLTNNQDMTFTISDFTDVPNSNGQLAAGDLDGDDIDDFVYKNKTASAWYKGDGAGGFTKFNNSHYRTAVDARSGAISVGDLNGDGKLEVVSNLGRGDEKIDSTQSCYYCLDVWQNAPSFDLEIAENTAINTVLTTFSATDVDSDVIFSLAGPDKNSFSIDASSGSLSVTSLLNYELPADLVGDATNTSPYLDEATNKNAKAEDNFYQVSINISDGKSTVSTPITILVNDVVE